MELVPSETVLLVRTADASELLQRLSQTNTGRLLGDEQMAAFVEAWGQQLEAAYNERLRDSLGIELTEIGDLLQGEVAFALVERVGQSPAAALLVDLGDRAASASQIVDRLKEQAADASRVVTSEQLRNDAATVFRRGNDQDRLIAVVERGSTFLLATDRDVLQSMLDRWDALPTEATGETTAFDGDEQPVPARFASLLASSPAFRDSLRECVAEQEEPPQVILFVDPVGLIRATVGQQTPVRLALAAFPALGLDGIEGAAAAIWLATDKWDSLTRGHLLLDNPRAGVLKIARLEPGDPTPPPHVPADAETVITAHADPNRLFADIERLVDRFRFDGSFQQSVDENVSEAWGVDFAEEVVANLAGNVCVVGAFDEDQTDINKRFAVGLKTR
ncbi:MAG: hypothetical protein AAGG46_08260, partial [Planctomycetota bacterium]